MASDHCPGLVLAQRQNGCSTRCNSCQRARSRAGSARYLSRRRPIALRYRGRCLARSSGVSATNPVGKSRPICSSMSLCMGWSGRAAASLRAIACCSTSTAFSQRCVSWASKTNRLRPWDSLVSKSFSVSGQGSAKKARRSESCRTWAQSCSALPWLRPPQPAQARVSEASFTSSRSIDLIGSLIRSAKRSARRCHCAASSTCGSATPNWARKAARSRPCASWRP